MGILFEIVKLFKFGMWMDVLVNEIKDYGVLMDVLIDFNVVGLVMFY